TVASTTNCGFTSFMAPSNSRKSAGKALRTLPVQSATFEARAVEVSDCTGLLLSVSPGDLSPFRFRESRRFQDRSGLHPSRRTCSCRDCRRCSQTRHLRRPGSAHTELLQATGQGKPLGSGHVRDSLCLLEGAVGQLVRRVALRDGFLTVVGEGPLVL